MEAVTAASGWSRGRWWVPDPHQPLNKAAPATQRVTPRADRIVLGACWDAPHFSVFLFGVSAGSKNTEVC